jgi:phosphoserine phosphatase
METELILFDLDDTLMAFNLVSEKAWEKSIDIFVQNNNRILEERCFIGKNSR